MRHEERFSAAKGTPARNFEVIGFRPNYPEWAELLVVTDSLRALRDGASEYQFVGYDRIELLRPGQVHPVDVIQTPETDAFFLGNVSSDWIWGIVDQYDTGELGPDPLSCRLRDESCVSSIHGIAS